MQPRNLALGELQDLNDDDWGTGQGRWSTLGGWRRNPFDEDFEVKHDRAARSNDKVGRRSSATVIPQASSEIEGIQSLEELVDGGGGDFAGDGASVVKGGDISEPLAAMAAVAPIPTAGIGAEMKEDRSEMDMKSQQQKHGVKNTVASHTDRASSQGASNQELDRPQKRHASLSPQEQRQREKRESSQEPGVRSPQRTRRGSSRERDRRSRSWQEIVGRSVWEGIEDLNEELGEYPLLSSIEKFTRIPKAYLALGTISILILLVFFGFGTRIISSTLGYLVPLYTTLCLVEEPQLPVLKHLLCYWVFFYVFRLLEPVLDQGLSWLPLYYVLKLVFLWWCYSPSFEGASRIYKTWVRSTMRSTNAVMEESLEPALESVKYGLLQCKAHVNVRMQKSVDLVHSKCMELIEQHDAIRKEDASLRRKAE